MTKLIITINLKPNCHETQPYISQEIFQELLNDIADKWNDGDRMPYINFCTDNSVYMVPRSELIIGRDAIKDFVLSFPDVKSWYTMVEVFGKQEQAVVRGSYILKNADGSPMDKGKFLSVCILTNVGEWKQIHTIWNSDLPHLE